ncbi:MAG TPA: acetyl-CoA hydrolase/transferase C-terminal domain-containing protein [Sporichthya sp.]|nr:acetyl-CoA hydrolase/transferase C-terminal domain-containing protein [Sporichthya sp.]
MTSLPWRDAGAALARVPAGAHLVSLPGMGAPTTVLGALAGASAGRGWTLSTGLLLDEYPFLPAVEAGELGYRTWHVAGPVADLVADGRVGFVPARASAVPDLLRHWGVDVALVRVSPPDAGGLCSLGPSVSYAKAAMDAAAMVIAEIDPAVPRTCGDSLIRVSAFDSVVESATPIPEYRTAPDAELSRRIAEHVLNLVPRNPALQIGLGTIPESLLRSLPDADLGRIRFIGMGTDLMVDLFDKGVLSLGDVVPWPAVLSGELMGTSRLLEFAHQNPAIGMAPSSVIHNPCHLAGIDRFVSIITALQIDLAGNVNAEVLRGRQISGPGGGPDFVDGAARSPGGLRIVALPSSSSDGRHSRIVSRVEAVTVPGTMIDAVVTEHGVARLAGLTGRQRAEALIALAAPAHRDPLAAA